MSKKSRFRGPFEKQHRKRAEPLFKSVWQHLYHINWSLPIQFSWKKSLLLRDHILGLLGNTLAADEKYPVLNRDNLTIPIQMQLSQKQNIFSEFFARFLKSAISFKYCQKKKTTLTDLVYPILRTPESWSDKCLKSPVWEKPSTSNMVNVSKQCWNLHHSTFIKFIAHCQVNWVGKRLAYTQV